MPPSDLTDCHTGLGRLLDDPRLFLIAPAPPALRPQYCDLHRPDDPKASLKVRTPPQLPLSQEGAHRLAITHIVGPTCASSESAVILSVTPNHGGVTDERWCEVQRARLAG